MAGRPDSYRTIREVAGLAVKLPGAAAFLQGVVRSRHQTVSPDFRGKTSSCAGRNVAGLRAATCGNACGSAGPCERPAGVWRAVWAGRARQPLALSSVPGETIFLIRSSLLLKQGISSCCATLLRTARSRSGSPRFGGKRAVRPSVVSNSCRRIHAR